MTEESGIAYCPECGAKVPENAKFCVKCGHNLGTQEPKTQSAPVTEVQTEVTAVSEVAQDTRTAVDNFYNWPNWLKFFVTLAIASFLSIFIGRISYVVSFVLGFIFFKPKK
ncbi:zinc ribbon domain-containing protein [Lacticaseibacillus parakribbianus]|uniref:zinc ribbon domain-containing protein n=1 Tax=Lacticaseibacillus parakribbianus TaxID=2970927 RepID=UPI0021CB73FB|nr:zinc ribbon domain-containing protein [Lacticaseibacillus parakribbianus]